MARSYAARDRGGQSQGSARWVAIVGDGPVEVVLGRAIAQAILWPAPRPGRLDLPRRRGYARYVRMFPGARTSAISLTRVAGAIATVSLVVFLSAAGAGAHDCSEPGKWFRINLGVTGFNDCHLHAWAARYYFPQDHDPKWLAVDLALQGNLGEAMTFRPDDIHVLQPDGSRTPLISQRTYRRQRAGLLPLLLRLHSDANRSPNECATKLRFFVDDGLRHSLADVNQYRCVQGYLFFAAPTGQWASGIYELVVGADVGLRIPFRIE